MRRITFSLLICLFPLFATAQDDVTAPVLVERIGDPANFSADANTLLITGANRGIGLEFVKQYGAQGWNIIATARKPGDAADLKALATDNKQIVIPNAQIMGSIITNYSANETRRVDMVVGVSYDDDIDEVRAAIRDLIDSDERVLKDPQCLIAVSDLADSSVNFDVRPWVKTADYWGVKYDFTEALKKRFDKEGISFPFPQQDVHLYQKNT